MHTAVVLGGRTAVDVQTVRRIRGSAQTAHRGRGAYGALGECRSEWPGGYTRPGARGAHAPPRDCLFFESASCGPYHRVMRFSAAVLLVLLGGCAIDVLSSVPARVASKATPPQYERLHTIQRKVDGGDIDGGLRDLDLLAGEGRFVEAERLRQDLLRQRGRLGFLRSEAAARVAAAPTSADELYLYGRLLPSGSAMHTAFASAAELEPESLWPWLGLAFSLRDVDPSQSLAIYERLYAASEANQAVAVAYASSLRSAGRLRDALQVYETMAKAGGLVAGVGHLGMAQTLFALGSGPERALGWVSYLSAVRARPFDPGVHGILRELLRAGIADEQVEQCLDALRESEDRWRNFARGAGTDLLASVLPRLQQPQAALIAIEAVDHDELGPSLRRQYRRLLLACGDSKSFHSALRGDLPRELLLAEDNQVRAVWLTLIDCADDGEDPCAGAEAASSWCAALRDAGLLAEAELAVDLAVRRHGANDEMRSLREEVRMEVAFENVLRRLLYRGYAASARADLDSLLLEVRRSSIAMLGKDVVEPDVRFTLPLVGEMVDPFAAGLSRHLARYNRYIVIGRRAGGVAEGLLFTRLSVRDLPTDPVLPVQGRCREVVGVDRSVRSLSGVLGGDLAGVALMNHYLIDHDAVVEWAQSIAARRATTLADRLVVLDDPVPPDTDVFDPLDASYRLAALSRLQDIDLEAAVLEVIRLHERRHLVDSFHYLPFEDNVWRGLGLILRFGLSPAAIEAEMERRAELAALAETKHPEIVLAHIAEFLAEDDQGSPHVKGFSQLARDFAAALRQEGVSDTDAAVARWYRLDPAIVRRAAQRLLNDLP